MSRRNRYDTDGNRLDAATSTKIGSYLYDRPEYELESNDENTQKKLMAHSRNLLAGTIIKGRKMSKAVAYYSALRDFYGSKNAMILSDILALMAISDNGIGRAGAEAILKGQLPKEIEIETSQM